MLSIYDSMISFGDVIDYIYDFYLQPNLRVRAIVNFVGEMLEVGLIDSEVQDL